MPHAIETRGLVKTFGATRALDGLDLTVQAGSVYGLLGPNGAGKTTAIRVLATLSQPTEGSATVLGHDVVRDAKAVRRKVSLTGQYASVDEDLTGHENLVLVGRLLGIPTVFVETFTRIDRPSLTGRIMYRLAHRFLYQWPGLARYFPRAVYGGRVV